MRNGNFLSVINFMSLYNLSSVNNIHNCQNKTLDLVLTSIENSNVSKEFLPLVNEDKYHPALNIVLTLPQNPYSTAKIENQASNSYYYQFNKVNLEQLRNIFLGRIHWSLE